MNERIKQFYEDHKEAILVGAVVGVVTGMILIKKNDGNKITSAALWTSNDDGKAFIRVTQKNGNYKGFLMEKASA